MRRNNRLVIRIQKHSEKLRPVTLVAFFTVFCLPFSTVTISGVGLLMILAIPLLIFTIPVFLRRLKGTSWDVATLLLAAFFAFNVFAYLWTPSFSAYSLYNYLKIIMIVMCFYCQNYTDREKQFLLNGSVLSCMIVCGFILTGRNIGYLSGRPTIAVFGVAQDPNYIGFLFLVSMAVSIQRFLTVGNPAVKLLWAMNAAVILFCVLMTGSRGALLGLAAIAFTCVIMRFRKLSSKVFFCILLGSISFVIYEFAVTLLPEDIAARFSVQAVIDSRGTGRTEIWLNAFRVMMSRPYQILFGFGSGSSHYLLNGWATHNFLIQLLLEQGIAGTLLFLGFLWIWIRRLAEKDVMCLSILMGCMAMAMTLSINTIYYFWLVFIQGIVCSKAKNSHAGGSIQT